MWPIIRLLAAYVKPKGKTVVFGMLERDGRAVVVPEATARELGPLLTGDIDRGRREPDH